MFFLNRYIIWLSLIFAANNLPAQNLTGTWEGALSNDQFLQLNIIQNGDRICGYTRDNVKADTASFCKAFFEGRFDKKRKMLIIKGKYFLQTTAEHELMKLRLNYKIKDGVEILEQNPFEDSLFSRMVIDFRGFDNDPFKPVDSSGYVYIRKVADQPYEIIELMKACIDKDEKKTEPIVKTSIPPKPTDSLPPVVKIITPQKPKDSLPVDVFTPVKKDSVVVAKPVIKRKNTEQSRIEVNVKTINLKVYDNALIDGDTVSIFYNDKLLLSHKLLSEKPIEINLEMDEKQSNHEIILFAENLGSIPPNTALIVITAGSKRYELFASANLQENAVLVFDYKPK